jgi:hypothetical protein
MGHMSYSSILQRMDMLMGPPISMTGRATHLVLQQTLSLVPRKLNKITILGVEAQPKNVKVAGKSAKFAYDVEVQRVVLSGLKIDLNGDVIVTWS